MISQGILIKSPIGPCNIFYGFSGVENEAGPGAQNHISSATGRDPNPSIPKPEATHSHLVPMHISFGEIVPMPLPPSMIISKACRVRQVERVIFKKLQFCDQISTIEILTLILVDQVVVEENFL